MLQKAAFGPIRRDGRCNIRQNYMSRVFWLIRMKKMKRQLVLNKGTEKFIFRYEDGKEDELLDALIDRAREKRTDFDWFDAAVLSFKLTQSLIGQADQILNENRDVEIHSKK